MSDLSNGVLTLSSATEGANNTQVATFMDANLSDTASAFTATIDWGDGTAVTPGIVTAGATTGSFIVTGTHTYADESNGPLPMIVSIIPVSGTPLVINGPVTVSETDVLTPTPQQNQPPISIIPGQPFGGPVATFTDSNTANVASDFTAMIDWGDGTTSTGVVNGSNGSFTVSSPVLHTYASTGHFSITVTIAEDAPGTATTMANNTAFVGAILGGAAQAISAQEGTQFSGTVATVTDSN